MSSRKEVEKASKLFYAALNRMLNGDAAPLADVWVHSPTVTTMHPVGGRQVGWEDVWKSWQGVAQLSSDGRVQLDEQIIEVAGDLAYELGVERGQFMLAGDSVRIESRVTNVYRRAEGGWKMVHHHTDLSPVMLEALGRLPPHTAS